MTRPLLVASLALTISALAVSAHAQCGAPSSSCRQCHEAEHRGTFVATEAWHADHAFGDFCFDCHGGTPTAHDDAAHFGLVDPLAPPRGRCATCHQDHPDILMKYAGAAGTPPEPPNTVPAAPSGPTSSTSPPNHSHDLAFSALVGGVGLAAAAYVVSNERRRRGRVAARVPARSGWSPYLAGGLLGIVVAVSMAIFGHRLSGGGAYQELAAPVGRLLTPRSVYWQHVISGTAHWDVPILVGAIVGSFVAAVTSGRFRLRTMPDSQWSDVFGTSVSMRWFVAFIGAALTEFAAGVAGGCTASLAISGGAALAPGAFAFMGGMFAAGVPTAWLIYRKARS